MRALRVLAPVLLAAAGCGDPLFFAQVKEERLCLSLQRWTVPAAPTPPPGFTLPEVSTPPTPLHLDLGDKIPGLDKDGAVKGDIRMLSLDVLGTTTALSGVRAATVVLLDRDGHKTPYMHYEPPSATPGDLAMTLEEDVNLLDRLQQGALDLEVTFTGTPPTTEWTAEVQSCITLDVTIDALKAMK